MAENIPVGETISPTHTTEAGVQITGATQSAADKPKITYLKGDQLLLKCLSLRKEGMAAKKIRTANWDELSKFALGSQWPERMPKYRVPAIQNFVFGLIERKAALLTDTNPIIKIQTTHDHTDARDRQQMSDCARALELYIQNLWTRRSAGVKFFDFFQMAEIYGGCGVNVPYTTRIDRRGGIDLKVVDPRTLIIDPAVNRWYNLSTAEYVVYEELWPTDEVRDTFRGFGSRIQPTVGYTQETDNRGSILNKVRALFGWDQGEVFRAVDRTLLSEFWIKDRTRDEKGDKLFSGGRHIIVANAVTGSPVILVDEPNPYMDGACPIDFMDWHSHINSIWGFGDVDLYRSTQEVYNKMLSLLVENATLVNNAIWIGDKDALAPEEWKKLTNAPGLQVKKRPGRELKREGPPPFSGEFAQILTYLMGTMEKLSGLSSVLEGRMPAQATSGIAIENLQSAAQVVIRAKARQFEDLLERVGQRLISRIFQYVEDNRIFAVTGDEDMTLAYHSERERIRNYPRTYFEDYRFEVQPGSSLSTSRWQNGLLATQLFSQGIVDDKCVLDSMEYPNRDEIQERMAIKREAEMKLQIAMAQQADSKNAGKPQFRGQGGSRNDQMTGKKFLSDPELHGGQTLVKGHPDVQGGM